MTKRQTPLLAAAFGAALLAAAGLPLSSARADIYTETGDAGQTLATATATGLVSGNSLLTVFGTVSSSSDVDLFRINVASATTPFVASTVFNSTSFDTQLYLFDATGRPVFTNNNVDPDPTDSGYASSALNGLLSPGLYYLGIGAGGSFPVDANGVALFATGSDPTAQYGPNPATALSLANFNTAASDAAGTYQIDLQGVTTAAIPEPSTWALLTVGTVLTGLTLARRRAHHA